MTKTILALDCATGPCSVALWKNGGVTAYLENVKPSAQSAVLMPMIEEVLSKSNMAYGDLSAIAATIGPGSFTGIRVGLSAARGIAFAAGIKGLGFTTLEVMAFGAQKQANRILAILNAGKGEYYYQLFATSPQFHPLSPPQLGNLQEITGIAEEETHIVSNVSGIRPLPSDICHPRADALAELAATREADAQPLTPFYMRPPDAKPSNKSIG